ncbi:MAG: cytochrome P450 [Pseudomonadota bacterium]
MSAPAVLPEAVAREVIAPASYGEWHGLLDTFDRLREEMPIGKVIAENNVFEPFWLITRYDDVRRISKDNKTFLNNPKPVVFATREATEFSRKATGSNMLVDSLVVFDAPIHPKYRKLTMDWFMPRNLKKMEDEIRALANKRIDEMIANGPEIDFVKLVAAPMPLHVIMQILGIPEEDEPRMLMLTQQMFGGQDADLSGSGMANMTPEQITMLVAGAVKSFEDYFAGIAAQRRSNPTDDVASVIANARVDGELLPDRDMAGYYIIMAAAGHDTTSATMSGAMHALASNPHEFAKLKADRSLLPGLVEEAIRSTSAVQHFMRTAAEDVEVGGQLIRQGDWMMLNYVAANHDPAQFEKPRTFDASRSPNRHMAFGAGAHQCLGLHLARMQIRVLFDALLDRIESVEIAGEAKRANTTFVGGLKTLPLQVVPR